MFAKTAMSMETEWGEESRTTKTTWKTNIMTAIRTREINLEHAEHKEGLARQDSRSCKTRP